MRSDKEIIADATDLTKFQQIQLELLLDIRRNTGKMKGSSL